jgi:hypothetical protein
VERVAFLVANRAKILPVVLLLAIWGPAWMPIAAEASAPVGFVASPALQEVQVRADVPRVEYGLQISNRSNKDQNFRLSVVDFGSLDEEGGVAFLGTPTSELDHKYGLASWMILEKDAVFIPAGKSQQLVITIDNRPSLAPGGHYGAILATAVDEFGRPAGDRVGVKQVLSSLVLATKEGGANHDLNMVTQTSNAGWVRLPTAVVQRFQNAGNVHVTPRGTVAVKDAAGRVVARGAMNEESAVILPESFRRYKTPLARVGTAWLPGQYRLVTTYRYDGTDQTKSATTSFWYAGLVIVWLAGLGALAAVGGLAWWLWVRPRRRKRT